VSNKYVTYQTVLSVNLPIQIFAKNVIISINRYLLLMVIVKDNVQFTTVKNVISLLIPHKDLPAKYVMMGLI